MHLIKYTTHCVVKEIKKIYINFIGQYLSILIVIFLLLFLFIHKHLNFNINLYIAIINLNGISLYINFSKV